VAAGGGWLFWRERTADSSIVDALPSATPVPQPAALAGTGLPALPPLEKLSRAPGWETLRTELGRLRGAESAQLWDLPPGGETPRTAGGPVITDDFRLADPAKADFAVDSDLEKVTYSRSLGIDGAAPIPELRLDFLGGTLYRIYVRFYASVDRKTLEHVLRVWLGEPTASNWRDTDVGDSLPCNVWRFADATVVSRVFTNPRGVSWSGVQLVDPARHPAARDFASAHRK
jgi:hypothetical protein